MNSRNSRHWSPVTFSSPPDRLRESLTSTNECQGATSTHSPPLMLARLLRQAAVEYSSCQAVIKHPFFWRTPGSWQLGWWYRTDRNPQAHAHHLVDIPQRV